MAIRRHDDQPEEDRFPAAESIDEALARLARQDKRLNPAGSPTTRAVGRRRGTRDRIWTALRWLIILGIGWLIWRATQGGGR